MRLTLCKNIFFYVSTFTFLHYLSLYNACNMAFQIKMNFFYQGILCANVNFMLQYKEIMSLFLFSFSLCYYKITLLVFLMQLGSMLHLSTLYIVCIHEVIKYLKSRTAYSFSTFIHTYICHYVPIFLFSLMNWQI